jgi:hypothetical protein
MKIRGHHRFFNLVHLVLDLANALRTRSDEDGRGPTEERPFAAQGVTKGIQ